MVRSFVGDLCEQGQAFPPSDCGGWCFGDIAPCCCIFEFPETCERKEWGARFSHAPWSERGGSASGFSSAGSSSHFVRSSLRCCRSTVGALLEFVLQVDEVFVSFER